MSKEEKEAYSRKISELTSGENNPMYGRKLKDCMTPEKYKAWRKSNAEANRRTA